MPYISELLRCAQGDTFAFSIVIQPNADASIPSLTGATAEWVLAEGPSTDDQLLLTKTSVASELSIALISGLWTITCVLVPSDTKTLVPGEKYHECKVTLMDGSVSHPSRGPFMLDTSKNP